MTTITTAITMITILETFYYKGSQFITCIFYIIAYTVMLLLLLLRSPAKSHVSLTHFQLIHASLPT